MKNMTAVKTSCGGEPPSIKTGHDLARLLQRVPKKIPASEVKKLRGSVISGPNRGILFCKIFTFA